MYSESSASYCVQVTQFWNTHFSFGTKNAIQILTEKTLPINSCPRLPFARVQMISTSLQLSPERSTNLSSSGLKLNFVLIYVLQADFFSSTNMRTTRKKLIPYTLEYAKLRVRDLEELIWWCEATRRCLQDLESRYILLPVFFDTLEV